MSRHGKLAEHAIDRRIPITGVDDRDGLLLRDVPRQLVVEALDADLGARPVLAGHIDGRGRVLADQDRGQAGPAAVLLGEISHFASDLVAQPLCDRATIDHRGRHQPLVRTASGSKWVMPWRSRTRVWISSAVSR